MTRIRFSLSNKMFRGCHPAPQVWQELVDWYQTALGSRLAIEEKLLLDEILPNLFGYHLCQLGVVGDVPLYANSRVSHCFTADISLLPGQATQLQCSPFLLPFRSDSIDVVIVPHLLEFTDQPHEMLREVERSLISDGHVVITGINPFSLWNMWRSVLGWRRQVPWCGRLYSVRRVKDWLALLGFDVELVHYFFYRPPTKRSGLLKRLRFIETVGQKLFRIFGGCYVIVAKKRVTTLTPIRKAWVRRRVVPGLVEPFSHHENRTKKTD